MNFGIPFKSPFGRPFGVPFLGVGGGGFPEPTGFVAKYTAYTVSNFGLVTGDNVSLWKDESTNGNDLTQATSANQPVLVEQDVVKQATLANQPTYDSAEKAMVFDEGEYLNKDIALNGDWAIEFDLILADTDVDYYSSRDAGISGFIIRGSSDIIRLISDDNSFVSLGADTTIGNVKILVKVESDTATCLVNGVTIGTPQDVTGKTYSFGAISRNAGGSFSLRGFKQWNSADSSGTPDFTLDASDQSSMRTSANEIAQDGENVAKWYAQEHNSYQNRVVFDTNDYMEGLPPQAGDFTYVIKCNIDSSNPISVLLSESSSIGTGRVTADVTNSRIAVVSNEGGIFLFTGFNAFDTDVILTLKRDGDDLLCYQDGVQIGSTLDFTGNTILLGDVSRKVSQQLNGSEAELWVYPRALTQDEINWFSYLRDQEGNILQPPLLPSTPTIYDVNSATLNGSTQYYDAGNSNDLDVSSSFTLNIWVHPTVLNTSNGIFSKWNTSSGDWSFISAIINDKPYISFSTTGSDNNELTGATDIVVDQMYMITATYDGSTLKLYANGVEDANSLSVTGNVYISSESLRIGSVRDNNIGSILYFTGSLAMPMIYNRALTSTEITALYNEGTVPCYADIDTSITDDCVYAPPLYNGADVSVGQELTDQSTSGITTTAVGSPPYTDQGLQVECQN